MDPDREAPSARPRYRWPWFVLAGLLLGLLLALLWMGFAVRRLRELRDPNSIPAGSGLSR
jgi:hypothetical protein